MGSWVGPWVPFSKLSRQKAIETCEILIEQRDRQIRRAEAAEARLAEVEAMCNAPDYVRLGLRSVDVARIRAAARGEGDQPAECNCASRPQRVCDICQGVTGGEGDRPAPMSDAEARELLGGLVVYGEGDRG